MAITAVTPVADSTIAHGDSFSFTIDDTYTSLIIKVQAESALEKAYDTALGGAQPGYTVTVVDNGDGTHTVTTSRDAGWDKSPQLIYVEENETGSTATTNISYTLTAEQSFPQGTVPYNPISEEVGGGVDSVFTRTGDVVAEASDYDASQIDNDSTVAGTYVSDALNTLKTSIDAIPISDETLVWEWNGTDVTQFEGTPAFASDAGAFLSVVANTDTDEPYDNSLRIGNLTTGGGGIVWLINDKINWGAGDGRYLRWEIITASGGSAGYVGPVVYGDNVSNLNCYAYQFGRTAGWQFRVDNDVIQQPGATTNQLWNGGGMCKAVMEFFGRLDSGNPIRFTMLGNGHDGNTNRTVTEYRSNWFNEPPTTHDDLDGDRIGLSLAAPGLGDYGEHFINSIKVYAKTADLA